MKRKIQKLTPEQESRLPKFRDEWLRIGLDCAPIQRDRAEDAIKKAYRLAGLKEPSVFIHLDSPNQGAIGAAILKNFRDQVGDQVWDQVWEQVLGQVSDQVSDVLVNACYGQHDASWLGFYCFFRDACGLDAPSKLEGLMDTARECGWCWPFDGIAIITPKPRELHRDDRGRLHNEAGAALLYPDGWGIWAIHGVRVARRVVEQPDTITVAEIEAEQNAEVRRVMVERYGQARYLMDAGAKAIGTDDYGTLYRKELSGDEPILMVKVVNSTAEPDGTFKDYFLRVPPTIKTAREAVAWTFGKTADEYAPLVET